MKNEKIVEFSGRAEGRRISRVRLAVFSSGRGSLRQEQSPVLRLLFRTSGGSTSDLQSSSSRPLPLTCLIAVVAATVP